MKRYLLPLGIMVLLAAPALPRNIQEIEGKLEITNNMFVIVTDHDLSAGSDFDDSVVKSRRVMLIGYASEKVKVLNRMAGKRVRARGVLGQAFTRYHTEPLVLSLEGLPTEIK